jgi:hypothetical protein
MVLARPRERLTTRINSKNSLYPLSHFTEHLVGVFGKVPWGNDLDHESSSFLIRQLKRHTRTSSCNNSYTRTREQMKIKLETERTPRATVTKEWCWALPTWLQMKVSTGYSAHAATKSDCEEQNGSWAMAAISERPNALDEPRETQAVKSEYRSRSRE